MSVSAALIAEVAKKATNSSAVRVWRIVSGEISQAHEVTLENGLRVVVKTSEDGYHYERERWAFERCGGVHGIPIPAVLLVGQTTTDSEPLFFCVQNAIEGQSLLSYLRATTIPKSRRRKIAYRAGEILSRIHSIPVKGFGYIKGDGAGEYSSFAVLMRQYVPDLTPCGVLAKRAGLSEREIRLVREILLQKAEKPPAIRPCFNHNDYTLSHIFLGPTDDIVGIIDWGEIQSHSALNDLAKWDFWCSEEIPTAWLQEGYGDNSVLRVRYEDMLHLLRLNIGVGALLWYVARKNESGINKAKRELLKDVHYFS